MARTKVLLVHHRPELGGAPTSLAYLARHLDRARFDVAAYAPPGASARLLAEAGARVHTGPVAGFTHIWASTYRGARWLLLGRELARLAPHALRLRRVLREERPDVVHLNDSPLVAAAVLARLARARVVWHLRASLPGDGRDLRSRLLARAIGRLAHRAVAINEDVAASFAAAGDVAVVFNAVDLERFAPGDPAAARRELGLPEAAPLAAYVGFLYPRKGFRELLDAFARVQREVPDARLVLAGGGVRRGRRLGGLVPDHEAEARELAAARGLADAVTFLPYTERPELVYRAADVVVAPSRGPELGRPVLEGAAAGRPVVATGSMTGGGVLRDGETGLLARADSPESLAEALAALLRDAERREAMGRAAREHAVAAFGPARAAARIAALYEEVLR